VAYTLTRIELKDFCSSQAVTYLVTLVITSEAMQDSNPVTTEN